MSTKAASGTRHGTLIAAIGLLAVLVVWFLWGRVHYVADYSESSYSGYFWPRRSGLLLHLAGGFTAIVTGLVQLWLGFTGRTSALHRRLGRVYVGAVITGAVGATYLV
jgi:hypothetical protein